MELEICLTSLTSLVPGLQSLRVVPNNTRRKLMKKNQKILVPLDCIAQFRKLEYLFGGEVPELQGGKVRLVVSTLCA